MILRSNPVEFLAEITSVSTCFLMWEGARMGSEGATGMGDRTAQLICHWPWKAYGEIPVAVDDSCWWHVAFDHIRPALYYGTSIHHGIFELGLACATSQDATGCDSAGLGAAKACGFPQARRRTTDRWSPGSHTHPQPQGTLQSCAVHVRIQKRLPHFCTFPFLSLVFSLRDFRARRSSLLPAPSPCLPISHRNPSSLRLGLGMCF